MRPDLETLRALRKRVRQATGADRELDEAILKALSTPERGWRSIWPEYLAWADRRWVAPVTAVPIDAAVALVERVCPDLPWTVARSRTRAVSELSESGVFKGEGR